MSQKRAKAIRKLVRTVVAEKGGPVVERNLSIQKVRRYIDSDGDPVLVDGKRYETYTAVQQPGTIRSAVRLIKRAEKRYHAAR